MIVAVSNHPEFRRALFFADRGFIDMAEEILGDALVKDVDFATHPAPWIQRARWRMALERPAAAATDFETAIARAEALGLSPDGGLRLEAGRAFRVAKNSTAALPHWMEGARLLPQNLEAHVEVADALRHAHEGNDEAAISQLRPFANRPEANWYASYAVSHLLLERATDFYPPDAARIAEALDFRVRALKLEGTLQGKWTVTKARKASLFTDKRIQAWDVARRFGWSGSGQPQGFIAPSGRRETDRARVVELPEATVLSGEGWVLEEKAGELAQLFTDLHFDVPGQHSPFFLHVDNDRPSVPVLLPKEIPEGPHGAVAIGASSNFYHWCIDMLARLVAVERDPNLARRPLLLWGKETRAQREALALLSIDPERIVRIPYPSALRCRDLIVPLLAPWERHHALRWFIGEKIGTTWTGRPSAPVWLGRGMAKHRRLEGEDRLMSQLGEIGWVVADTGTMPLVEQWRLCAKATAVGGIHGAAMTNIVAARSGASIVELYTPAWPQPFFSNMSAALGNSHRLSPMTPIPDNARFPMVWDAKLDEITLAAVLEACSEAIQYSGGQ